LGNGIAALGLGIAAHFTGSVDAAVLVYGDSNAFIRSLLLLGNRS
jgi:hypothetical protein